MHDRNQDVKERDREHEVRHAFTGVIMSNTYLTRITPLRKHVKVGCMQNLATEDLLVREYTDPLNKKKKKLKTINCPRKPYESFSFSFLFWL